MAEPGTVEVEVKPVVTEPVPGWPVGVYGAIAAAAGEMKAIEKDQKNQGQNKYDAGQKGLQTVLTFKSIHNISPFSIACLAKRVVSNKLARNLSQG